MLLSSSSDRGVSDLEPAPQGVGHADGGRSALPAGPVFVPRRSADEDELGSRLLPSLWASRRRSVSQHAPSTPAGGSTGGGLDGALTRAQSEPRVQSGNLSSANVLGSRGIHGASRGALEKNEPEGRPLLTFGVLPRVSPRTSSRKATMHLDGVSVPRESGGRKRPRRDLEGGVDDGSNPSLARSTRSKPRAGWRGFVPNFFRRAHTADGDEIGDNVDLATRAQEGTSLPSGVVKVSRRGGGRGSTLPDEDIIIDVDMESDGASEGRGGGEDISAVERSVSDSTPTEGVVLLHTGNGACEKVAGGGGKTGNARKAGKSGKTGRISNEPQGVVHVTSGRRTRSNLLGERARENTAFQNDEVGEAAVPVGVAGGIPDGDQANQSSSDVPMDNPSSLVKRAENSQPEAVGKSGRESDAMQQEGVPEDRALRCEVAPTGDSSAADSIVEDASAVENQLYWETTSCTPVILNEDSASDDEPPHHLRISSSIRMQAANRDYMEAKEEAALHAEEHLLSSLSLQNVTNVGSSASPCGSPTSAEAKRKNLGGNECTPVDRSRLAKIGNFRSRHGRLQRHDVAVKTPQETVNIGWVAFPDRRVPFFCPPKPCDFRCDRLAAIRRFRKKNRSPSRGKKKNGPVVAHVSDKTLTSSIGMWPSDRNDITCPCTNCLSSPDGRAISPIMRPEAYGNWASVATDDEE